MWLVKYFTVDSTATMDWLLLIAITDACLGDTKE